MSIINASETKSSRIFGLCNKARTFPCTAGSLLHEKTIDKKEGHRDCNAIFYIAFIQPRRMVIHMNKSLKRASPSSLGIKPSAISAMVDRWESLGGMHSFILLRHGKVAAEGWWKPYAPQKRHMLFSLSKSFTSIASAFAVAEGKLDYEDSVVSFFPDYDNIVGGYDGGMSRMKVKHLLSMCTGHKPNADFIFDFEDSVSAFLSSKTDHEPGVGFSYNTGATYMVSAIVQRVTGQTLLDYLTPRLFEPLGIENVFWDSCWRGVNYGGFGLNVKTEDIAKLGQFLLNRGQWEGKQLLPAALIDAATAKHINNWGESKYPMLDEFVPEEMTPDALKSDWSRGYGRQFWRCVPDGVYRGDGAFGQLCVVMPEYDVVVACNAGLNDMQGELNAIWDSINDDAFEDSAADTDADAALAERLKTLSVPAPSGGDFGALGIYSGRMYQFSENQNGWRRAVVEFGGESDSITIYGEHSHWSINAGHGSWTDNVFGISGDDSPMGRELYFVNSDVDGKSGHISAASSADGNVYNLRLAYDMTPFICTFAFTFEDGRLELRITYNVGHGDVELHGCVLKQ